MQVVERAGKRKHEILTRQRIFGITAVHGVSGEDRSVAKIFEPAAAIRTDAIDAADPGNADSRTGRKTGTRGLHHLAYDLVTGHDAWVDGRQLAFDDMKVCAAHPAGADSQKHVPWSDFRHWNVTQTKRLRRNAAWPVEHRGSHSTHSTRISSKLDAR